MTELLNQSLRKGDVESFSRLFRQTHPRLMGYCSLFVENRKDAEDIVQECFFNLWKNRENIDVNKSVESLLFVSLRNQCLNYLKKNSKFSFKSLSEGVSPNELQYLYQIDFSEKKDKSLEEELIDALNSAIRNLPGRQKEILIKCKIEGRKQKEVAEELGITVKAIEKSLSKSKLNLQAELLKQFPTLSLVISVLLQ